MAVPFRVSLYLRDSSRVPRRRPFIYSKPPYAIGSVPSLSGHTITYRWPSLPRVRRHRVNKPQGSSKRVLPWQVTMGQLICASLSHTHCWYEVGMLKCMITIRGGYRMARGWHYTKLSLSSALLLFIFSCMCFVFKEKSERA